MLFPVVLWCVHLGGAACAEMDTAVHRCLRAHAPAAWRQPFGDFEGGANWTAARSFEDFWREAGAASTDFSFLDFILWAADRAENIAPLDSDESRDNRIWDVPSEAMATAAPTPGQN